LPEDVVGELAQPASIRAGTSAASRNLMGRRMIVSQAMKNAF